MIDFSHFWRVCWQATGTLLSECPGDANLHIMGPSRRRSASPHRFFEAWGWEVIHDGYVNKMLGLWDDGEDCLQVLSPGRRAERWWRSLEGKTQRRIKYKVTNIWFQWLKHAQHIVSVKSNPPLNTRRETLVTYWEVKLSGDVVLL